MHYSVWAFSKNGKKTIEINGNITNICYIGQQYKLSNQDIIKINNLIGKPKENINLINEEDTIKLCGGMKFNSYNFIFTEYKKITETIYQSTWQYNNIYIYLTNSNGRWEIRYANKVFATSIDLNQWTLLNRNTKQLEIDETTFTQN